MSEPQTKGGGGKTAFFGCLTAALVFGIVLAGCGWSFFAAMGTAMMDVDSEVYEPGPKVAHIDLDGIITSSMAVSWAGSSESMVDLLSESFKRAKEDEDVKAIVLRINSPGGEVTASDTLYHRLKQLSAEKPVVVYMDSMAASGGYYIACGANEIIANQTTITGSIGVIISTINYSELFDKVGLDSPTFTSGEYKDTLSGSRVMRPDEQAMVQSMVDGMYERFLEVVMEGRPDIPEAELRADIADGRIFNGKEAVENGLVDATGYIEDAYARARELGGLSEDAPVVPYNEDESFFGALGLMKAKAASLANPNQPIKVEIQLPEALGPQLKPGVAYMLPSYYAP